MLRKEYELLLNETVGGGGSTINCFFTVQEVPTSPEFKPWLTHTGSEIVVIEKTSLGELDPVKVAALIESYQRTDHRFNACTPLSDLAIAKSAMADISRAIRWSCLPAGTPVIHAGCHFKIQSEEDTPAEKRAAEELKAASKR